MRPPRSPTSPRSSELVAAVTGQGLLEGFGGIREIKAFGIENTVIHNFNLMSKPRIDFFTKWHVIRNLPKMFFEIIIVTAAAFLAYFLIFGQGGLERTLIVLGIFVAASFRILPSLNRVLVGLQGINYGYYSTKLVIDSLGTDNINKSENIKSKITEFKQNISDIEHPIIREVLLLLKIVTIYPYF